MENLARNSFDSPPIALVFEGLVALAFVKSPKTMMKLCISRLNFFNQVDMGVVHGDELQYIFSDVWGEDLSMSPADVKFTRNVFTFLLTNFAKTG